ncbi:hypothetical protein [Pseudomonas guariconensis]|uniref:hypothetical protein n=1 Tax=Pseudomonas TaxID=286 RepID=UPI00293F0257|nr:hypothetical protein [Pseudomonas guariconensis]
MPLRLQEMLVDAVLEVSVAEVGLRHGVSNAGRFSLYFQQAYGVCPADVKRGGRG